MYKPLRTYGVCNYLKRLWRKATQLRLWTKTVQLILNMHLQIDSTIIEMKIYKTVESKNAVAKQCSSMFYIRTFHTIHNQFCFLYKMFQLAAPHQTFFTPCILQHFLIPCQTCNRGLAISPLFNNFQLYPNKRTSVLQ